MNLYPTSFSKGLGVISEEAPDAWVWRNGPAVHRFAQKTRERAEQFKPPENDVGWIIPTGDAEDCGKFYKLAGESYSVWKFEQEQAKVRESTATIWNFLFAVVPTAIFFGILGSCFGRH